MTDPDLFCDNDRLTVHHPLHILLQHKKCFLLYYHTMFIPRGSEKLKGGTSKGDIPIILNQSSEDERLNSNCSL